MLCCELRRTELSLTRYTRRDMPTMLGIQHPRPVSLSNNRLGKKGHGSIFVHSYMYVNLCEPGS